MAAPYDICFSGRVRFGVSRRFELGESLPPNARVMLVCGVHYAASREPEKLLAGHSFSVFCAPAGEPHLATVDALRKAAHEFDCTAFVAAGGGSVIDLAKSAALLYEAELPCAEYFYGRAAAPARKIFLAAVPTTAGTGAESTGNAVLSDPETKIKQSLRGANMTPDFAIVDPELLYAAPRAVLAGSGFDALTQALETLVSRKANGFTVALGFRAARLLLERLENACTGNRDSLDAVAEGSMLTGFAFAQGGLGLCHGIGHPLGSVLSLPHGKTMALLLPEALQINRNFYAPFFPDVDALA